MRRPAPDDRDQEEEGSRMMEKHVNCLCEHKSYNDREGNVAGAVRFRKSVKHNKGQHPGNGK